MTTLYNVSNNRELLISYPRKVTQSSCVKCDYPDASVAYKFREVLLDKLIREEYLLTICMRCGYSWEQPCADAKPK